MTEEKSTNLPVAHSDGGYNNLLDSAKYEHAKKVATVYSKSLMIPAHFRGKVEDVFVVCQMAFRMRVDPLMMLQNTYVVSGKPGLSGQMAIALINASGAFKGRIKFRYEGKDDTRACVAWALDRETGEELSCRVDMAIAKGEGWTKNSKWQTMRDQMLAYRAGAWFARMYCPDALFGLSTTDELEDMGMVNVTPAREEKAKELDTLLSGPEVVKLELVVDPPAPDTFDDAAADAELAAEKEAS